MRQVNAGVNNATINLNGFTIKTSASVADAVCGFGNAGVTIRNGMIDATALGAAFSEGVAATGDNARVERLQIIGSTGYAIDLGNAAVAIDNIVTGFSTAGINCPNDCVISRNAVSSTASGSMGIETLSGGFLEENTLTGNATDLSLSSTTGYGENVLDAQPPAGDGKSTNNNVCNGSFPC